MFERIGRAMYRRRWRVIGLAAVFVVSGGLWGTQVFGSLVTDGFDDPGSESSRAVDRAEATLGRTGNDVVTNTITYWGTNSPALVSHDRRATFAVLTLSGDDEAERGEVLKKIEDQLRLHVPQTRRVSHSHLYG